MSSIFNKYISILISINTQFNILISINTQFNILICIPNPTAAAAVVAKEPEQQAAMRTLVRFMATRRPHQPSKPIEAACVSPKKMLNDSSQFPLPPCFWFETGKL